MRHPGGLATLLDPARSQPAEWDTASCGHCQRVIFTKPGTAATVYLLPIRPVTPETLSRFQEEPGAFCRICMRPICLGCYQTSLTALHPCVVWERRLEQSESRRRLLRQVGIDG